MLHCYSMFLLKLLATLPCFSSQYARKRVEFPVRMSFKNKTGMAYACKLKKSRNVLTKETNEDRMASPIVPMLSQIFEQEPQVVFDKRTE